MDLLACRLAVALDEQDSVRVECRVDGSHRSARCLHDGNGFVLSEVEESGRVASGNNKQVSFVAAQSDGIDERESQVVEDDWDAGTASWCRYASQVLTERARKLRGVLHQATVRSAGTLEDQVSSRERRSRHVEQHSVASPDSRPLTGQNIRPALDQRGRELTESRPTSPEAHLRSPLVRGVAEDVRCRIEDAHTALPDLLVRVVVERGQELRQAIGPGRPVSAWTVAMVVVAVHVELRAEFADQPHQLGRALRPSLPGRQTVGAVVGHQDIYVGQALSGGQIDVVARLGFLDVAEEPEPESIKFDSSSAGHMEEVKPWDDGNDVVMVVQRAQPAGVVVVAGQEQNGHGGIESKGAVEQSEEVTLRRIGIDEGAVASWELSVASVSPEISNLDGQIDAE